MAAAARRVMSGNTRSLQAGAVARWALPVTTRVAVPRLLAVPAVAGAGLWAYNTIEKDSFTMPSPNVAFAAEVPPPEGIPGTNQERSFIAIKPDGVERALVGEIIRRFEQKGYKLVALKMVWPTEETAAGHYADLSKKPFFPGLVKYFSSGPIVAMVFEGYNVIRGGRNIIGATNPDESTPGSIRGDLCIQIGRNIIHGSDAPDSAKHEINFWFKPDEIAGNVWKRGADKYIYEKA